MNEENKTIIENETINNNEINVTKKSKKNIILVILVAIVVFIVTIVVLATIDNKDTDTKEKDNKVEEEIIEEDEEDDTVHIEDTTVNDSTKLYIFKIKNIEFESEYIEISKTSNLEQEEGLKKELVDTYTCKNKYCKDLYIDDIDNNLVSIYDEELIIYDYKNNKSYETGIKFTLDENDEYNESIELVVNKNKFHGFLLNTNEKSKYYSFENNKFNLKFEKNITEGTLEVFEPYIEKGYFVHSIYNDDYSKCTSSLVDMKDGKELSKINNKTYDAYGYEDALPIIIEGCTIPKTGSKDFLDENLKSIFDKTYKSAYIKDDNLIVYNDNSKEYIIYNKKNKEQIKKTIDYKILNMIKDYILVEKDGNYALIDYNNKLIKEFGSTKNTSLTPFFDYYEAHDDKPAGIYFGVEDDTKDEYCYEYYYNPKTGESKKFDIECGGYAKPVLYLYPTDKTEVTINFEKENMLTTTYPKFNKEWKVTAHPNGDLYDQKGNYYYALYWEEEKNHTVDFSEGFYVTKDNAITFLEEKLTFIGLNAKEKNEFIMYWLPILEKNEKSLVYFELTEERDNYNKIKISPKPDSMLRMAIHIKKVDQKVNIKEQKLTQFKRNGFTIVEWGGVKY